MTFLVAYVIMVAWDGLSFIFSIKRQSQLKYHTLRKIFPAL